MDRKAVSTIVSGTSTRASILNTLVMMAHEKGLTDEDIEQLATPEGQILIEQFVEIMDEDRQKRQSQNDTYLVKMPYGLKLTDMIEGCNFDWWNRHITDERFPIAKEPYEVKIVLVHLNRYVTTKEVVAELGRRGLRPATIEEILALANPKHGFLDIQRQWPIIGLGSSARIDRSGCVPYLSRRGLERGLSLYWNDSGFYPDCRFAAVLN